MKILDGKKIKSQIKEELKTKIADLGIEPKLVILQIAENSASDVYIKQKIKFAENINAVAEHIHFNQEVTNQEILNQIEKLNQNNSVHGIIVQLPIPKKLNQSLIIDLIDPKKDVDGLSSRNLSNLIRGEKGIVPATTRGILDLLKSYNISISGKKVVIVGRSVLVGKPTALAFLNQDATVTVCHSKTENLSEITKNADILISAVGKKGFITDEYVNKDQVIIDVGISKDHEGNLTGGVSIEKDVAYISPVPGGVGQMTVAGLFQNLVEACQNQTN